MTNEHLNTQLYWKLQREHTAFKNWLMHQPPGVIIENAYKYAMMEDVLVVAFIMGILAAIACTGVCCVLPEKGIRTVAAPTVESKR